MHSIFHRRRESPPLSEPARAPSPTTEDVPDVSGFHEQEPWNRTTDENGPPVDSDDERQFHPDVAPDTPDSLTGSRSIPGADKDSGMHIPQRKPIGRLKSPTFYTDAGFLPMPPRHQNGLIGGGRFSHHGRPTPPSLEVQTEEGTTTAAQSVPAEVLVPKGTAHRLFPRKTVPPPPAPEVGSADPMVVGDEAHVDPPPTTAAPVVSFVSEQSGTLARQVPAEMSPSRPLPSGLFGRKRDVATPALEPASDITESDAHVDPPPATAAPVLSIVSEQSDSGATQAPAEISPSRPLPSSLFGRKRDVATPALEPAAGIKDSEGHVDTPPDTVAPAMSFVSEQSDSGATQAPAESSQPGSLPSRLFVRKDGMKKPAPVLPSGAAAKPPSDMLRFADADEVVDYLNKRHFVVPIGGKAVIGTEEKAHDGDYWSLAFGSPSDLKLLYANRFVEVKDQKGNTKLKPIIDVWLSHERRRQFKGVVFSPGQEVPGFLNLFRGFSIQPKKGQCHLFWQHLFNVICRCNRKHYWYVRKWLAHLVQRPAELPGVGIVIQGAQGSGKGVIFEHGLRQIVGPQHSHMVTQIEHLAGRFNAHLKDCLFLYGNELHWGGDKTKEGAIKSMVTDTESVMEAKGRDAIAVRNFKRVFITSNSDRPVPLDLDDRRFLLLVTDDSRVGDRQYFNALIHQMGNGGCEALAYDLLRENLDGFDVRTKPASRFAFEVKLANAAPHVRFWYGRLYDARVTTDYVKDDEAFWFDPSKETLYQNYLEFSRELGLRPTDKTNFGKELNKMLGGQLSERRGEATEGDKRPWHHKLPPVSVCRKEFERYLKSGPELWEGARQERPAVQ